MELKQNEILAAKLNLECDYDAITKEILGCASQWRYTPPYKYQLEHELNKEFDLASTEDYSNIDYTIAPEDGTQIRRGGGGAHIFYLRKCKSTDSQSFSITKHLPHSDWEWRDDIDISYTKKFIDSLPFKSLGMIRVFIFSDTFLPVHKDYKTTEVLGHSEDYDKCLGLSIIPTTGDVPMKIWSNKLNRAVEVPGNAMLFNDSVVHGVPKTTGIRITIRVFGDIDYNYFSDKVDPAYIYYL